MKFIQLSIFIDSSKFFGSYRNLSFYRIVVLGIFKVYRTIEIPRVMFQINYIKVRKCVFCILYFFNKKKIDKSFKKYFTSKFFFLAHITFLSTGLQRLLKRFRSYFKKKSKKYICIYSFNLIFDKFFIQNLNFFLYQNTYIHSTTHVYLSHEKKLLKLKFVESFKSTWKNHSTSNMSNWHLIEYTVVFRA